MVQNYFSKQKLTPDFNYPANNKSMQNAEAHLHSHIKTLNSVIEVNILAFLIEQWCLNKIVKVRTQMTWSSPVNFKLKL